MQVDENISDLGFKKLPLSLRILNRGGGFFMHPLTPSIKLQYTASMCTVKRSQEIKLEHLTNIPRIGKLPYGAKRGFIERKALLKYIEILALLK